MSDLWLPGFQRVRSSHSGGGTMIDAPPRWVGHTTEGLSKDPAGQAAAHPTPPQCWVTLPSHPYQPRLRLQIIPLNRSGFALKHNAGDPETNKAGAVQVEIEGLSVNFDGLPDQDPFEVSESDLDWLATEVVEPMCTAVGVDTQWWLPTATVTRMTWPQWARFGGLCMHRNVPGQTHTDAPLDLHYISQHLTDPLPDPTTEEQMSLQQCENADGRLQLFWLTGQGNLRTCWQVPGGGWSGTAALAGGYVWSELGAPRLAGGRIEVYGLSGYGTPAMVAQKAPNATFGDVVNLGL